MSANIIQHQFMAIQPNLPPKRRYNKDARPREHLTPTEVTQLMKAIKESSKNPHRDETIVLMMSRRGLRVSELIGLKWSDISFDTGRIYVRRSKKSIASDQPLSGVELRALRKLKRDNPNHGYVFLSSRGAPLASRTIHHIIARGGEKAGFDMPIHPHMLRHSTGYDLINRGIDIRTIQGFLGHASINSTTRYTHLDSRAFDNIYSD